MEMQKLKINKMPKTQHGLDADEDDTNNYDILNYEDVKGQEEATIQYEELEEGYFDTDGNYYFRKVADNKDEWLDNVDWANVATSDFEAEPTLDRKKVYQQMLELMRPSETVMGALGRLGGTSGHLSVSGKWLGKSKYNKIEEEFDMRKFLRLAVLADSLVEAGDVELYADTFEKFEVLTMEKKTEVQIVEMFFK